MLVVPALSLALLSSSSEKATISSRSRLILAILRAFVVVILDTLMAKKMFAGGTFNRIFAKMKANHALNVMGLEPCPHLIH